MPSKEGGIWWGEDINLGSVLQQRDGDHAGGGNEELNLPVPE
jgi:hypothetical protein